MKDSKSTGIVDAITKLKDTAEKKEEKSSKVDLSQIAKDLSSRKDESED